MNRYIVVKTQFEALHCWPECPIEEVSFLKNLHRHIFYVVMKWKVWHTDRQKEFIVTKRAVDTAIQKWDKDLGRASCEDIADRLHDTFLDCTFVSVFEDNENGVEVTYDERI